MMKSLNVDFLLRPEEVCSYGSNSLSKVTLCTLKTASYAIVYEASLSMIGKKLRWLGIGCPWLELWLFESFNMIGHWCNALVNGVEKALLLET